MKLAIDRYVNLPENRAVQAFFDEANDRVLRLILIFFFIYSALMLGQSSSGFKLERPQDLEAVVTLSGHSLTIILCGLLFFGDRNRWFGSTQSLICTYFFVQLILLVFFRHLESDSFWPWVFPVMLLFLHLSWSANMTIYFGIALIGCADQVLPFKGQGLWESLGVLFLNGGLAVVSGWRTASRRRSFLAVWRLERNNRDRLRMKQELNDARAIQLSMLPGETPDAANLEIACISVPASEVGGDYYDYFSLGEKRLAVVIGDVAGHGVASGLVLSGVRSCLYLMMDDLPKPAEILGRLNRMLKKTTDKRMFMTFLFAVFDAEAQSMTLASAGHPPILHYSRRGRTLQEIRRPALPLGGIMNTTYSETVISYDSGDMFILYTDGIVETQNSRGEDYGMSRLKKRIERALGNEISAKRLRELLMTDVQLFMGDEEQPDDITLFVLRAR